MQSPRHQNDKQITHTHTYTCQNQDVNKMLQCYGIKEYTQTEKLQQIARCNNKKQKGKTSILIDVAIPTDRNVMQNKEEKKLK